MKCFSEVNIKSQCSLATPSGQLSDPFRALALVSQNVPPPEASQTQKPPVPLFSQGSAAPIDQNSHVIDGTELPCSQLDAVSTQDLITPVEQFQLDYNPNETGLRQRSPAQLSPSRIKRQRKQDSEPGDEDLSQSQQAVTGRVKQTPGGRTISVHGVTRRAIQKIVSPPSYRNMFNTDSESEQAYSRWSVSRPHLTPNLPRFKADFKEIGMLGQGSFSKVFRVRHRLDGKEYAVKRSIREINRDSEEFQQFIQEVQVLAHVPPHPGVVRYYSAWTEPGADGGDRLFTQLELCSASLGAHQSFLGEQLPERDIVEIARQIAMALQHLHEHGVAHMDIKPSNIYIKLPPDEWQHHINANHSKDGRALPPGTEFKLGDFGQASRLKVDGIREASVSEGDSRYLPLEIMNGDYSRLHKGDMFALGATLFELASGTELPSGGPAYQDLRRGKVPLLPTYSTFLSRLIRNLMSPNPDKRPSAGDMLQMPPINRTIKPETENIP